MVGRTVRDVLLDVVASAGDDPEATVDAILAAIGAFPGLRYDGADGSPALATAHGRVAMTVASDPTMTRRAISVYLDVSEAKVGKVISDLVAVGYLSKRKVGRRVEYRVETAAILGNPDVRHLLACVEALRADLAPAGTGAMPRTPRR